MKKEEMTVWQLSNAIHLAFQQMNDIDRYKDEPFDAAMNTILELKMKLVRLAPFPYFVSEV